MASCLGLYIENNLIKYAKVSKDKDIKKIETFGIKFYERIEEGIKQVIDETYSYKIPVCINLAEEDYQYFDMFSMLSKADLDKAIKIEFESDCSEKGYNANVFETRYAAVENLEDKQRLKIIFVTNNKIELNKQMQLLENYKLTGVYPLPIALSTVSAGVAEENSMIVNIEEKTTITTIIDKKIYNVKVLEQGSGEFLQRINLKENSYSKAYEMCKETTIYTSEGKDLTAEEAGYLEEIMPVLYSIVGQVQKSINESIEKIEKVYITGTAALVNNIDLYFQEYLEGIRCEILKPDFIARTPEINIKDYIEVNSPIAIALMGLGEGIEGMNFKNITFGEKLKEFLKVDIGSKEDETKEKKFKGNLLTNDLKQPLDTVEKNLLNVLVGILILFMVYTGFSMLLKNEFNRKLKQADESISNSNRQIALVDSDDATIKQIKSDYTTRISNLEEINKRIEEKNRAKGAIPALLNQLMNVVPSDVQIKSIQSSSTSQRTSGTQSTGHVEIMVESPKYEQIAFFIGSIKTEMILTEVISTSGQKTNNVVSVKIEGDLP